MFLDPYLYLYACGSFSNGVFISLRGPVIPELARRVGKPSAALGAYLGIGGLSGGVFALPTGAMLDRYDAHAVFAFGTLLRAVSVGATPLCSALWHVNLLAVVQGATLPLIGVSIRVCLVRAVGQARCAQALNFTMGAFGLASVVTPLAYAGLQRAFGPERGFERVFVVVALAYAALALATLAGFETPPAVEDDACSERTHAEEEEHANASSRGDDDAFVAGRSRDESPSRDGEFSSRGRDLDVYVPAIHDEESHVAPPRVATPRGDDEDEHEGGDEDPLARPSRKKKTVAGTTNFRAAAGARRRPERPPMDVLVPMTAYMCLSVASEVTYGSWIYTLATERTGLSDASAASLTSAFWAAFTATRFALSFVGAGPLPAVAFSHAVAFSATTFLALQWGGVGFLDPGGALRDRASHASRFVLWVVTLCVGCGAAGMFPNGIALGRSFFPLDGFAQAAFELGASVGSGLGPYVAARVFGVTGDSAAIPATCAASGAGAVAALVVALRRNAQKRGERLRLAEATTAAAAAAADSPGPPSSSAALLTRPLLWGGESPDGDDA
jgi:FHS family Na+ dependent glucose MFS transporter 1